MTHPAAGSTHMQSKRPVLRFSILFLLTSGILSWIIQLEAVQAHFVQPHLRQIAGLCGSILQKCGTECAVNGTSVLTASFSIDIVQGCDALYATMLFWSAVVAFPAGWRQKLAGLAGGAIVLFVLNVARVVSMLYIGRAFPAVFDVVHLYAWQALFILMTLAIWLVWASWSLHGKR